MIGRYRYGNLQKYQSGNPLQRTLIARFLSTVGNLMESLPVRSLLDVGCAEGFILNYLLQRRDSDLLAQGVDIDEAAIARGRVLHPSLSFQVADIYHLPFAETSFDLVLCLEVLEHLTAPEQALGELRRVARHFCLLSVPHEPFFRLANLLRGKNICCLGSDIDHLHNWSKGDFLRLVQPYLDIAAVKTSFPWLIVLGQKMSSSPPLPNRNRISTESPPSNCKNYVTMGQENPLLRTRNWVRSH